MTEGTTVIFSDRGPWDTLCEPVRIFVNFLEGYQNVRLFFHLDYSFILTIHYPIMGGIRLAGWGPLEWVGIEGGWAGGHDGGCRI